MVLVGNKIMFPKPTRLENPELVETVSRMRCTVCFKWPSDPHHVTSRGAGGGDTGDNLIPLCREHHSEWHQIGKTRIMRKYPSIVLWLDAHERHDVLAYMYTENPEEF